jgi:3-isopropylmalate dehydrogenase
VKTPEDRVKTHRIALLGGDGIGPEVVDEACKVLDRLEELDGFATERVPYDLGGRRYLATGEVLSDETLEELRGFDAIFLGAVGTPDVPPGVIERGLLLKLRFAFDQFVNLRPVKLYAGVSSPDRRAHARALRLRRDPGEHRGAVRRCRGIAVQGDACRGRHPGEHQHPPRGRACAALRIRARLQRRDGRLTLVHKTNVLAYAGDLWMRTFEELGTDEFSDVERDYIHVDAACLYFVTSPERFDVVVTENLFGDIITDLGAAIQGGMGLAASGNLDPTRRAPSMFEPVHGSAPDIVGPGRPIRSPR